MYAHVHAIKYSVLNKSDFVKAKFRADCKVIIFTKALHYILFLVHILCLHCALEMTVQWRLSRRAGGVIAP